MDSLSRAAVEGNLRNVKQLLQEQLDQKSASEKALISAASAGQQKVVEWLLSEGKVTMGHKDSNGNTALLAAAWAGHLSLVRWLVKSGSLVSERNWFGMTVLLVAAYGGHLEVVKWLLSEGTATVGETDNGGNTALLLASCGGHLSVVRWLLDAGGASVAERNKIGRTGLLGAALGGHLEVVKWLLCEGKVTSDPFIPPSWVNKSILEDTAKNGKTALLLAASGGHLDVIQWLLAAGAAARVRSDSGSTLLLCAAKSGKLEVVRWLLDQGVSSLDEKDSRNTSALLVAASGGHLDVAKWLVNHTKFGIDVDSERNVDGETALLCAVRNGRLETAKWLVAQGASTFQRNHQGLCLVQCAASHGQFSVIKWCLEEEKGLTERDSLGNTLLLLAASTRHFATVKWLVTEGGSSVDERNAAGDTVLLCAAKKGQVEMVKWLLGHGSTVHERNLAGDTVLLVAALWGQLGVVRWLLTESPAKSSVIWDVNHNDENVFLCAVRSGDWALVEWLSTRDEFIIGGDRALMVAARNGHLKIMQWLVGRHEDSKTTHAIPSAVAAYRCWLQDRSAELDAFGVPVPPSTEESGSTSSVRVHTFQSNAVSDLHEASFNKLVAATLNSAADVTPRDAADEAVSLEQKLQVVAETQNTPPAVKAMAQDAIYISKQRRSNKSNKCTCQGSAALVRTFLQLYQGMLMTAEQAYTELRRMRKACLQGSLELAEEHFSSAQHDCIRVASVVQHIIDCKFDVSDFKCPNEQKCNKAVHSSAHIGQVATRVGPSGTLPSAFENKEWHEEVVFRHRLFDGEPPKLRSHLDYMCAKAASLETTFHLHLQAVARDVGIYHAGPLKTKRRCIAKLPKYAHLPKPTSMHLKDLLRGSIVCRNVDHMRKGLRKLDGSITLLKDRLQARTHDVLVSIVFEEMVCEVQFHLHACYSLNTFSHGPYEVMRVTGYKDLLDEFGKLTLEPFELEEYDDE